MICYPKIRKTFKIVFVKLLFRAVRHPNAGRLPDGVPQHCLFLVHFFPFLSFFCVPSQGVDQRLVVNQLLKIAWNTVFQTFFLVFWWKITKKHLKSTKKFVNSPKKYFNQLLGACSTLKLVKIHNTWRWVYRLQQHILKFNYLF